MICFILDFTFIFVHFYIFIFYNIDIGQVPFKDSLLLLFSGLKFSDDLHRTDQPNSDNNQ